MDPKSAEALISKCWEAERRKTVNYLKGRFKSNSASHIEIKDVVSDAFAENYKKLIRGGFGRSGSRNLYDIEQHLKLSIRRTAFNLMLNRVGKKELCFYYDIEQIVEDKSKSHAVEEFFERINNDCVLKQFWSLWKDERTRVFVEIFELIELRNVRTIDVAKSYGKESRWVYDKKSEGISKLKTMIEKNCKD